VMAALQELTYCRPPSPSPAPPALLADTEIGDGQGDSSIDFDIADFIADPELEIIADQDAKPITDAMRSFLIILLAVSLAYE